METFLHLLDDSSGSSTRASRRRKRAILAALILAVAGCAGEPEITKDAEISGDLDARALIDAGSVEDDDAGADDAAEGLDAGSSEADASAADAAVQDASPQDAEPADSGWGGCSVDGVAGACVDVSLCTGDQVATPGHCPGPANIQCCTPRGATFACDPNVHLDPNHGLVEAPGAGGCPDGMISIAAPIPFCVDRYEASLLEVHADGSTSWWSPYHHPDTSIRVRAVSLAGAVPQGYVDGVTAQTACTEAGKRLCTDAEWLRACRGPSDFTFPYGDTRMAGVCNDARAVHPAVELFPNDPNPFAHIQDACINQLPDSLDRTGVNPGCATAEGAFDMMGNLHEWTADPAGTFRGGFYVDTRINGNGCLYVTTAHDTHHWDYSTGFRCCADHP